MRKMVAAAPMLAALITCTALTPVADAAASLPVLIRCAGRADIQVDQTTGAVTGTGTLTGCVSATGAVTSGTVAISGRAILVTPAEIVTVTSDSTTWNTGRSVTGTETRTFTGVTRFVEVGTGASPTAGAQTETATGTRTNPANLAGAPAQGPLLVTLTFDDAVNVLNYEYYK